MLFREVSMTLYMRQPRLCVRIQVRFYSTPVTQKKVIFDVLPATSFDCAVEPSSGLVVGKGLIMSRYQSPH